MGAAPGSGGVEIFVVWVKEELGGTSGWDKSLPVRITDAIAIRAAPILVEDTRAAIRSPGSLREAEKMKTVSPTQQMMHRQAMTLLLGRIIPPGLETASSLSSCDLAGLG
jgi:hypothetical protein